MQKKKKLLSGLILFLVLFLVSYLIKDFLIVKKNNIIQLTCPEKLNYNQSGKVDLDVVHKIKNSKTLYKSYNFFSWNTNCGRIYAVYSNESDFSEFGNFYFDYKGDFVVTCNSPFSVGEDLCGIIEILRKENSDYSDLSF